MAVVIKLPMAEMLCPKHSPLTSLPHSTTAGANTSGDSLSIGNSLNLASAIPIHQRLLI